MTFDRVRSGRRCREVSGLFTAALFAHAIAGCEAPPRVPTPAEIFEPDPNHDFHAAMGDVQVNALAMRTVCFTTDGTDPVFANGTCMGGTTQRLPANGRITLTCGTATAASSPRGIKLAFDWPGSDGVTVQTVAGNFVLDCTQPPPDTDGDGVPNNSDNCPMDANADQADRNMNGIGDACEMAGAPDADGDGRPDSADNCPMVWNVNQADDDNDHIGNVCDPTPRGAAPLPWVNNVLARAFVAWKDEIQCRLNGCRNPGGAGSWNANCDNTGGTVEWAVRLSGLRALSTFTYRNCQNTVTVPVHDWASDPRNANPMATVMRDVTLTTNGTFSQDTDFSGNGSESGTVMVTGDFSGSITSHVQISGAMRARGSYFSVACSSDPIEQEMCAPDNLQVNFVYPDWGCEPGSCPAPPAPLTDRDGDGVFDDYDNCPDVANPNQANADFDRQGDACDSMTSATDTDRDGVPDDGDNCPMAANPMQEDADRDGLGDACDTMNDPDTDMDGVIDARDNCPMAANPTQTDTDMDGQGDACDATPMGTPRFSMLRVKSGHCLYDNGGDVRSTGCNASATNQHWEVLDRGGRSSFRNLGTMRCLTAATWAGDLSMRDCDAAASNQQWGLERYDQGGFETRFPMRFRSAAQNYCVFADGLGSVYASQGNCSLGGTENGRKFGIYPGGNFDADPVQPM